MPKKKKSEVYFCLCKCRKHGAIVFKDGSKESEILNKTHGYTQVEDIFKNGKISEVEASTLRKQIDESGLPEITYPIFDMIAGNVKLIVVELVKGTEEDTPTSLHTEYSSQFTPKDPSLN